VSEAMMKILSNTKRELREEDEKRSTIFFFFFSSSKLTFNNNEQNDEYHRHLRFSSAQKFNIPRFR